MKQCLDCSVGKIHFYAHGPYPGRKLTMIFNCRDGMPEPAVDRKVIKQTGRHPFEDLGYFNVFYLDYWIRFCKDDYWKSHVISNPEKWVKDENIRLPYTPAQKSWVRKMIRESRNAIGCKTSDTQ